MTITIFYPYIDLGQRLTPLMPWTLPRFDSQNEFKNYDNNYFYFYISELNNFEFESFYNDIL
jgi:hypothetical protein